MASVRGYSAYGVSGDRVFDHWRFLLFRQARRLFPVPKTFEKKTPADSGLLFEDLRIAVNAADRLHAWWIPAAASTDKAILVFHGNGYVLEDMIGGEMDSLRQIGANLMLIDYRGYGSSTPIGPNETTMDVRIPTSGNSTSVGVSNDPGGKLRDEHRPDWDYAASPQHGVRAFVLLILPACVRADPDVIILHSRRVFCANSLSYCATSRRVF